MYRSSCFLGKPTILSSRSHPVRTQTRKLLKKYGSVSNGNNYGRLMSTAPKYNKWKNRLYWGCSVAGGILFGSGVTLLAKSNDEFRRAVEDGIPISKYAFNYIIPATKTILPLQQDVVLQDDVHEVQVVEDVQDVQDVQDDDVLVVNIMDTPYVSQIDFEVGSKHEVATDIINEVLVEGESVLEEIVNAEGKTCAEEIIEDVVGLIVDVEAPEVESIVSLAVEAAVILEDVLSDVDVEKQKAAIIILSNAYEHLRIILDDTITTKTSASSMFHGYITQFCQALLVPKDDPAYDSMWEAVAVLEHNVQESIDLAKVKVAEVNSQEKKIVDLMYDIRKFGVSDIADKADALIVSSNESLVWAESQIEIATNKLNFLLGFQRRVEGSPQKLQEYLEDFKPDLIKLLNLKQYIDAQNLSSDDALLMLSLQRPELIYAEVHEKEAEQKKQFEATLQQQKEDLDNEAHENLINVIKELETNRDNEQKLKVEELNELHNNHLEVELKLQSEANQQEIESALAKQESELNSQHKDEITLKLNEQEDKHYLEVEKNLSHLKGIQSKITEVVNLDDQQRRNRHLWVAAQALTTALNNSSDNGRTRSLMPEISNVMQCSVNDDVLATIVETMPKSAANLGVIPESALLQRFSDVKRVCKRVAMVKDEGGSILVYTFSYIKSLFVISRFYQRSINDNIDLETIGPYEILEKADYYIQQGDLVQAAKFMSQLKGVPRKLCADWLKEVRLLLETKQSTNLLMAYAGSFIAGFE